MEADIEAGEEMEKAVAERETVLSQEGRVTRNQEGRKEGRGMRKPRKPHRKIGKRAAQRRKGRGGNAEDEVVGRQVGLTIERLEIDMAIILRKIADKEHDKLAKRRVDVEKVARGAVAVREAAEVHFIEDRAVRKRKTPEMSRKGKEGQEKDERSVSDVKRRRPRKGKMEHGRTSTGWEERGQLFPCVALGNSEVYSHWIVPHPESLSRQRLERFQRAFCNQPVPACALDRLSNPIGKGGLSFSQRESRLFG
jgi:hypothetical protein